MQPFYNYSLQFVMRFVITLIFTARASAIQLAGDRVRDRRQLLALLLKVFAGGCSRVLFEPLIGLLDGFQELYSVST